MVHQVSAVRLSWLLRPYAVNAGHNAGHRAYVVPDYDGSEEAHRFYRRMDFGGLSMTLLQYIGQITILSRKQSSVSGRWLDELLLRVYKLNILITCLQLVMMFAYKQRMCSIRHTLAAVQRCWRLVLLSFIAVSKQHNLFGPVQTWYGEGTSPYAVLAGAVLVLPSLTLQVSLDFALPVRLAYWVQPAAVAVTAALVVNAPAALLEMPGMEAAAQNVCSTMDSMYELISSVPLRVVTWWWWWWFQPHQDSSQVIGGGGAVGDICHSQCALPQLMLFAFLLLALFVPLLVLYTLELNQKLAFYRSKNMSVTVDPSAFLPFPSLPGLSRVVVLLVWPVLLWNCAEAAVEPWRPDVTPGTS
eukprot:gene10706-10863_t